MPYISGDMRVRSRAFDTIVDKNRQALTNPKVARVLGNYAAILTEINGQLFLPNVRNTAIQLPKAHRMDNHAALLPILPDDPEHGLVYSSSMFLPGAAQLDRTSRRLSPGKLGLTEQQARQSVVNAVMLLRADSAQTSLDGHLREVAQKRRDGLFPTSATLGNYVIMPDEEDLLYGRQMVAVPAELADFSVPAVGSVVTHEELHVDDNNKRDYASLSETSFGIHKELRGYYVGALILGSMSDDILPTDRPVTETTLFIERLRQHSKQGTDEPPFSVNVTLAAYFAASEQARPTE